MRILHTILYIVLAFSFLQSQAAPRDITFSDKTYHVDSIINSIIKVAPEHSHFIKEYHANYYMKERLYIEKKNILFRYLPFMFRLRNGERHYIRELASTVHYTAPNIYDQKINSSVGTIPRRSSLLDAMIEYFHVNIYSNSLLYQRIVSPVSRAGSKYYHFSLDSIFKSSGYLQYRISFWPRFKSDQLVRGSMIVSDGIWSIRSFHFSGYAQLIHFENEVTYGAVGSAAELLPVEYKTSARVNFFGNKVSATYLSSINYHGITTDELVKPVNRKSKYDLSESFSLSTDTTSYSSDRNKFNGIRRIPLDSIDHQIYDDHDSLRLQEDASRKPESKARILWGQIGDMFIDRYYINFNNAGRIRCSPLFNPFTMGYSNGNGFSYKQRFKYNCLFPGDKMLRMSTDLGYNFREKFLYWKVNTEYDYYPSKMGSIHIDAGNGNLIYGAEVLSGVDNPLNMSTLKSYQFKDYFLEIYHSLEVVNGLQINVGLSGHRRTAVIPGSDLLDIASHNKMNLTFNSWAPRVRIEWTPAQYYYLSGRRKVNFKSAYPTFSIDWERGIKGMLKSDCGYERWELDMQHTIDFGVLRKLYYRIGTGLYTNRNNLYFIDFLNFTRNALAEQWNDERSTSFELLKADWYNSSRHYFQIHSSFESPFLIIPRLMKIMRNVVVERIYLNFLVTPKLKPYYEVGYGISTHYFSFRAFASFNRSKYVEYGTKFTFEMFD